MKGLRCGSCSSAAAPEADGGEMLRGRCEMGPGEA